MKTYKNMEEWYHPEIDYFEMIENFRWTPDALQRAIKRAGYDLPQSCISLHLHAKAWEFDEETKSEEPGKQQIFQFYNKQYNDAIAQVLHKMSPRLILDVGAGDGLMTKLMKARGFNIIAVDNYSWEFRERYADVIRMDYKKALAKYNPDVVISSWMPLGTDWTPDFRKTKSVKHYIQIGEVNMCCGGDWEDRKTWPIQTATEATKYALCRTDSIMFSQLEDPNNILSQRSQYMMHHSEVNVTSRRRFALTID